MRLLADRAVRHRPALEAPGDRLHGLHLVERQGLPGVVELEQAAQRGHVLRAVVDQLRVLLEDGVVVLARRLLQLVHGLRVEQVVLPTLAPLVLAAGVEAAAVRLELRVGGAVAHAGLGGDDVEADPLDAGVGPGEVAVDHLLPDADRLEDLRAAVRLEGRDAHFRHHLHDPLHHRLVVVVVGLFESEVGQHPLADQVAEALVDHVRVDGVGAVPEQQAEVVDLARLPRLDGDARPRPLAGADQVVVQPGYRQQRRYRGQALVEAAVGEDQDGCAAVDRRLGRGEQLVEGLPHALLPRLGGKQDLQLAGLHPGPVDPLESGHLGVGQDGPRQAELAAALRLGLEEVPLRPQGGLGRGDQLLPDRVDGRVGDLREQLLEVAEQRLRPVGQHRQRRVVPHRADRPDGVAGHRHQVDAQVLEGEPEHLLPAQDLLVFAGGFAVLDPGEVLEIDEVLVEPLPVRVLRRPALLQLLVGDDAALGGVDEKHPPRLQAALVQDVLRLDVEHADLGTHDDAVVGGDVVAGRAQAVAVEHGPDLGAVGEGDRGRTVPRFHQAGVVLVERLLLVGHRLVLLPRLGDHHHHRVAEGAAGEVQELEAVVELRRVAAVLLDDGEELLEVVAEQPRAQHRLARVHPVLVAPESVDLAVVDQVAVRVRPLPAREGVGAEAGVDEDDGRFEERVRQVGVVALDLAGGQHPLVDDGAAGNALEVEILAARPAAAVADLVAGPLADDVELALEVELPGQLGAGGDEQLPDAGLAGARRVPEIGLAGGHVAPAQDRLPLFGGDLLEPLLAGAAIGFVGGQEQHGDAVAAPLRQVHPLPGQLVPEEAVRYLGEDAGAVAGVDLAAAGAAVVEIAQHLERLLHDAVGRVPPDVCDKPDAAPVVLVFGVIEALGRGQEGVFHRSGDPDSVQGKGLI